MCYVSCTRNPFKNYVIHYVQVINVSDHQQWCGVRSNNLPNNDEGRILKRCLK